MNENAKEFLTVARELLMGEHIEDACTHYYKVQEENPENAEAAFFADYLAYLLMIEEKNLDGKVLTETVRNLINDDERRHAIENNVREFAVTDTLDRILEIIKKELQK